MYVFSIWSSGFYSLEQGLLTYPPRLWLSLSPPLLFWIVFALILCSVCGLDHAEDHRVGWRTHNANSGALMNRISGGLMESPRKVKAYSVCMNYQYKKIHFLFSLLSLQMWTEWMLASILFILQFHSLRDSNVDKMMRQLQILVDQNNIQLLHEWFSGPLPPPWCQSFWCMTPKTLWPVIWYWIETTKRTFQSISSSQIMLWKLEWMEIRGWMDQWGKQNRS